MEHITADDDAFYIDNRAAIKASHKLKVVALTQYNTLLLLLRYTYIAPLPPPERIIIKFNDLFIILHTPQLGYITLFSGFPVLEEEEEDVYIYIQHIWWCGTSPHHLYFYTN
jgi:hypothetical protein